MKKKIFIFMTILTMLVCSCAYGYSDVGQTDWFYGNVTEMLDMGYLAGYEDGTFRPSGIITKAELVSVVGRVSGLAPSSGQTNHWAAPMPLAA